MCLLFHRWEYCSKTWITNLPGRPDIGQVPVTLHFRECKRCKKLQSSYNWLWKRCWRNEDRRELLMTKNIKLIKVAQLNFR